MTKQTKIIGISVAVVLVLAGAWYFAGDNLANIWQRGSSPVAHVNGDDITRAELNKRTEIAAASAIDPSTVPTEEDVLGQMVEELLFLQDAQTRGITASESDIQEEFDLLVAQFESREEFDEIVKTNDLTEEELREELRRQIIFEAYAEIIRDESGIVATDEEVQELYEGTAATQETIPPLEDVREEIETQIVQDKLSQEIARISEQLHAEAQIEILI